MSEKEEWDYLQRLDFDIFWLRHRRIFRFWFSHLRHMTVWIDNGWGRIDGTETYMNTRLAFLVLTTIAIADILLFYFLGLPKLPRLP